MTKTLHASARRVERAAARRDAGALHGVRRQRGRARRTRRSAWTCSTERGLSYIMTAPGDLGLARAYVAGRPRAARRAPGRPLRGAARCCRTTRLPPAAPAELLALVRGLGLSQPQAAAAARRRSTCRAGAGRSRACGTR